MEKTEFKGIYKEREGVFINKDSESLKAYKKRKQQAHRLITLEKNITDINADLQEIKTLLKGLIK